MSPDGALAARWQAVRETVAHAAGAAGRRPDEITVVAVSKKHPLEAIVAARAAGIVDIGENYAQEMVSKMDALAVHDAGAGADALPLRWHFIGALQRNKARQVVGRAHLLHAVDSDRLVREIDKRAAAAGVVQAVLLSVNIAGEATKSGVAPDQVAALLAVCAACPAIRCEGLMTMPPLADRPDDNRPHFAALRALRDRLASAAQPLPHLSMGTTDDYPAAVAEGATLVRVGTAIFGPRPG